MFTGYQSAEYSSAFEDSMFEPHTGAHLQIRRLEDEFYDLSSLYPLWCPPRPNYSEILNQFHEFENRKELVSLTLVTDPLININTSLFDYVKENKTHYLVNLRKETRFSHNHWLNLKKFVKSGYEVTTRVLTFANRIEYAKLFHQMYQDSIVKKHNVTGPANFSAKSFSYQMNVPGLVLVECLERNGIPISSMMFMIHNNNAYWHLTCNSERGYQISANYGMIYFAINFFRQLGFDTLVLGVRAGVGDTKTGLEDFKSGWANDSRTNFVVGKIFNPKKYNELSGDFFPLYRR